MKISRMNKGNWGKVRAFFDLTTQDGFTIKGFKLIEGINGLFVSMPSQKGSDDEYYDTIWIDSKELREQLNSLAMSEYQNPSAQNSDAVVANSESTGNNMKEESQASKESEKAEAPAFSDDDIPF
jgi:stage V sporulation protein G